MTSRVSPDDADRSGSERSPASRGERAPGRDGHPRTGPENAAAALRSRLSTLGVALVALAVVLSLIGAAVTPAAATGESGEPVSAGESDVAAALATADPAGSGATARREIDGAFSRSTYTGTAGDVVEIRHVASASGNDTAYLLVGGNRLTDSGGTIGFVDVLKVRDTRSTTINTRLIGTNESTVDSCSADGVNCSLEFKDEDGDVIATTLTELRSEFSGATGAGDLARPVDPERYRLAITNGTFIVRDSGAVDPVKVAAESDLVLRAPTFHDEVEVFTTADAEVIADGEGARTESLGVLRENGVDRTAVTKGDRVVLGFESTGIWGAMAHFAESRTGESLEPGTTVDHRVLVDLLEAEEGVSLTVRQTNPGRNELRTELDLADADPDDITLFLADGEHLARGDSDRGPSRFYLAIDTSDDGPFTDGPDPGDEYAVEFALEGTEGERYAFSDGGEPPAAFDAASATDDRIGEQYPYHGTDEGRVSAEATFSVRERYLRYDHVTDDRTVLVEADNGNITGTTSILPSAELSATIVRDTDETPNRTESELAIANESFSVDSGLAGVSPGTRASYRLYLGQSLLESRPILIVENASAPAQLRLANGTTTDLTVTRGESLANLSATIENVGQVRNRERLTLDVDEGAIVDERHVTVTPATPENETFSEIDVDLEPGEYPYTLSIDGNTLNGTLTVTADPAVTRVDDDAGGSAGGTGDGTESGTDEPDDGDANNGAPNGTGDDGGAPTDERPDDSPATLLPFGIGTRETFGGTVLVGATYILGHWV
ncbi:BGTF surface domain-containing protein [Halorubrum sp. HHNYT27]|uniref:BGTF surface domain-containing protein n=1 Tax=Halorubrum sp. HHNYT27 TaxID=3402275 RepID=UPI003EBAA8E4